MKVRFEELEALGDAILYWLETLDEKGGLNEAELYRKFHLIHLLKTVGKKLIDYEPGASFNWKLSKVEIFTILRSYGQMQSINNRTLRTFIFRLDAMSPGVATPGLTGRFLNYDLYKK